VRSRTLVSQSGVLIEVETPCCALGVVISGQSVRSFREYTLAIFIAPTESESLNNATRKCKSKSAS